MRPRPGRILWLLFAVFVVYGTTIPFDFVRRFSTVERKLKGLADNPLSPPGTPQDWSAPDLVQNFLLFVPFGFLGVFGVSPGARSGLRRIALVTGFGAVLGVGVEGLQLFTRDRTSSLTDVITNTLGTGFGAVVANRLRHRCRKAVDRMIDAGWFNARSFYPMLLAAVAVWVLAWVPFDITLDVGMIAPKVRLLASDVWQYAGLAGDGAAIVQFALFAVTIGAWLAEQGHSNPATTGATIAVAVALGLEASQIVITSRMPGLEPAAVRALGAITGASLWTLSRDGRHRRGWLLLVIVATIIAAHLHRSSTSEMIATRELYRLLFLADYQRTSVPSFIYLTEQFFLYASAGFALARSFTISPTRGIGAAMLLATLVAAAIGSIQPQATQGSGIVMNIATSMAGAGLGAYAATTGAQVFANALTSWQAARLAR